MISYKNVEILLSVDRRNKGCLNLSVHRDHEIVSTANFGTERQTWSPKVHSRHSLLARCSSWTRLSQRLLPFWWKDGTAQPRPDSAAVCFWLKWRPESVQKDLVFWSMKDFSYTVCRRLSEVSQCPPAGFLFDAGYSSHEYSANPPLWPVIPTTWETISQMKTISNYVTLKVHKRKNVWDCIP